MKFFVKKIYIFSGLILILLVAGIFTWRGIFGDDRLKQCLSTKNQDDCYRIFLQSGIDEYTKENYAKALEYFQLSAAAFDNDKTRGFTVWRNIANSYQELDQYDQAIEIFDELLKINHEDVSLVYLDYIRLYERQKKYEDALQKAKTAFSILKNPVHLYSQANILESMERYTEEIAIYEELLVLDPDNKANIEFKIQRLKQVHNL